MNIFDSIYHQLKEDASESVIIEIDRKAFEADKDYNLHGGRIVVIEGAKGWILSDCECIHYKMDLGAPALVQVWDKGREEVKDGKVVKMLPIFSREEPVEIFLEDLERFPIERGAEPFDWSKFVHYFGIKDRMARNYELLQKSCRDIGARIEFPPFWAE